MKTVILCALFLLIGAVAGSGLTGYFVDRFHKRVEATVYAGDVGLAALQAELIKAGDSAIVLNTLERRLPDDVVAIHENSLLRDSLTADAAIMGTKRFYVCSGTAIPDEIGPILEPVSLPADACEARR